MVAQSNAFPEPRTSFHRWLNDFDAVPDEIGMWTELVGYDDPMPAKQCGILDLPAGATYRDAVLAVFAPWTCVETEES